METKVVSGRVVFALETTALAGAYYSLSRRIIIQPYIELLSKSKTTEVALIVFTSHDTARSCLHRSPWTTDPKLFLTWLDAVPHLMEGTGSVAAYEAISEALHAFHQPSAYGTVDPKCQKEIIMLWISDAAKTKPSLPAGADGLPTKTSISTMPMQIARVFAATQVFFSCITGESSGRKNAGKLFPLVLDRFQALSTGKLLEAKNYYTQLSLLPMAYSICNPCSQRMLRVVNDFQEQHKSDSLFNKRRHALQTVHRSPVIAARQARGTGEVSSWTGDILYTLRPHTGMTEPQKGGTSFQVMTVRCTGTLSPDSTLPPLTSWPAQLAMASQHQKASVLEDAKKAKPQGVCRLRIQVVQEQQHFKAFSQKVKLDVMAVKISIQEAYSLWLVKEDAGEDHFTGIYMQDGHTVAPKAVQ